MNETAEPLYLYAGADPLSHTDPYGLKWVDSGVRVCGFIWDGDFHGTVQLHNGKVYGFYAVQRVPKSGVEGWEKHVQDFAAGTVWFGKVVEDTGSWFLECRAVELDDCCMDQTCYLRTVRRYVENEWSKGSRLYSAIDHNCYDWRNEAVGLKLPEIGRARTPNLGRCENKSLYCVGKSLGAAVINANGSIRLGDVVP